MPITVDMTIAEIIRRHPATVAVFRRHGMECLTCRGVTSESLESGATTHGLDPEALLSELRTAAGGKDRDG